MTDKRYRICADCGQRWNVSSLVANEKKYICPQGNALMEVETDD